MISLSGMVYIVVYIVVLGLIWYLLNFLIEYCGVPEPWHKVAKIILMVVAVLVLIGLLLSLVTGQPVFRP